MDDFSQFNMNHMLVCCNLRSSDSTYRSLHCSFLYL